SRKPRKIRARGPRTAGPRAMNAVARARRERSWKGPQFKAGENDPTGPGIGFIRQIRAFLATRSAPRRANLDRVTRLATPLSLSVASARGSDLHAAIRNDSPGWKRQVF